MREELGVSKQKQASQRQSMNDKLEQTLRTHVVLTISILTPSLFFSLRYGGRGGELRTDAGVGFVSCARGTR